MIKGEVLPTGEYVVPAAVRGATGQMARVQAVLDTGCSEYLTLPTWVIERLGLKHLQDVEYQLADGTYAKGGEFLAEVEWLGTWREIVVVGTDGDALLGRKLLEGCHLDIDALPGGRVEISAIA